MIQVIKKWLISFTAVLVVGASATEEISALVQTAAPGTVFTGQQAIIFSMRRNGYLPVDYEVQDWKGNVIETGLWKTGDLTLKEKLPYGYYKLVLKRDSLNGWRSFAIVPELQERTGIRNDFYALDSGQACNGSDFNNGFGGADPMELLATLTQLAGIQQVRDRYYWGAYNPKPGIFHLQNNFTNSIKLLAHKGIHESILFIGAPPWVRTRSNKLPDNLLEVYTVMKNLAAGLSNCAPLWEFWNEPDIGSAPEPVWHFAACQKAAYLGIKEGDPHAPVLNGALSGLNGLYEYGLFNNGMGDYIDIFNIHTYTAPAGYHGFIEKVRNCLKEAGIEDHRIHITETSCDAEGTTEETVAYVNSKRTKGKVQIIGRHSDRQEMLLAEYYPKSMLALQQEGIARAYFFYLSPYNERNGLKDWGIMRRDASVKPVYAAISNMTWLLAGAKYRGIVDIGKGLTAYLLKDRNGQDILVFWSNSPLDENFAHSSVSTSREFFQRKFTLNVHPGTYTMTDLFGKQNRLRSNGKLTLEATRYPSYLSGKFDLPISHPRYSAVNQEATMTHPDRELAVILDANVNPDDFRIVHHKTSAALSGSSGKITITVWNLSNKPKQGTLSVENGKLDGLPNQLSLAPFTSKSFNCVFSPLPGTEASIDLRICGNFNGKEISRLTIPVQLETRLLAGTTSKELKTNQVKSWRKNASGDMRISFCPEEDCIRFDTVFASGKSQWSYPEYILQPGETLENAVMLAFEIKSSQDRVENLFGHAGIFLVEGTTHEHGKSIYLDYIAPIQKWEERKIALTGLPFPLKETKLIRIGGNPVGSRLTIWLRNVRIYYKAPQKTTEE